jgi:hypothetical protein
MTHYPTIDRFVRLNLPILAVVGVRDPLVSQERMRQVLDLPLNVTLVFHSGAAHAINYSHPGALARLVHAFLQDRPLADEVADDDEVVVVGAAAREPATEES